MHIIIQLITQCIAAILLFLYSFYRLNFTMWISEWFQDMCIAITISANAAHHLHFLLHTVGLHFIVATFCNFVQPQRNFSKAISLLSMRLFRCIKINAHVQLCSNITSTTHHDIHQPHCQASNYIVNSCAYACKCLKCTSTSRDKISQKQPNNIGMTLYNRFTPSIHLVPSLRPCLRYLVSGVSM